VLTQDFHYSCVKRHSYKYCDNFVELLIKKLFCLIVHICKSFIFSSQAYCNILAGACMSLGLRFAGSANNEAFETLFKYAKTFTSLTGKSIAELAGKSTIETCLNVILLSLAMVSCCNQLHGAESLIK